MKHMKAIRRTFSLLLTLVLLLCGAPEVARAAGFAAIVTSSSMQAYSDRGLTRSAGTIAQGEIVVVSAYSGAVAAITYKGKSGYARVNDLARVSDYGVQAQVSSANARAYEAEDTASRSIKLKKGLKVYVVGTNGQWARIVGGTAVAYTNIDWLTLERSFTPIVTATPSPTPAPLSIRATVTADSVKVYETANTSGRLLGTLKKGTEVIVREYNATWARVELNGRTGYCARSALARTEDVPQTTPAPELTPTPVPEPTPTPYGQNRIQAVVTKAVKAYAAPSTSSKLLGTLKKGTEVTVLDYTSTWAHIELNGKTGYCSVKALKKKADAAEPTPTPTAAPTPVPDVKEAIPATVTADSVKVYAAANASSKLIGTLKKGAEVNVVDHNGTWAFIELGGKFGFCSVKALTRTSDLQQPTVAPTGKAKLTATVVQANMPVYASKSTNASSTALPIGTTVSVYDYDSTWALIGRDGAYGYAQVKYLNAESYAALSSGSSGSSVLALQRKLESLGYFDGSPAGNYSTLTTEAVKRFQAAVGLSQTGAADETTQRVLAGGHAPASPLLGMTLAKGSAGANVTRLQTRLYTKGYLSKTSSVDGDYGSITVAAVKLFQAKVGLTASGTADSATLKALYSGTAPALTDGKAADAGTSPAPSEDKNPPNDAGDTPGNNSRIETVISAAKNQLGKPYIYATAGPNSFDCSGLTTYAFKQVGINLSRTAYAQGYNDGVKITGLSNLVRGDIVCMNTISDSDLSDHVGIYLGGGQMIHASSGSGKVIISSLTSGYYNRVFSWGRRIIQ